MMVIVRSYLFLKENGLKFDLHLFKLPSLYSQISLITIYVTLVTICLQEEMERAVLHCLLTL